MTQEQFYHSKPWRKLSALMLEAKHGICERCGAPASVVHHRIYLDSRTANDPAIALNPELLEVLCLDCHNKEHFRTGAVSDGLYFDQEGQLKKR